MQASGRQALGFAAVSFLVAVSLVAATPRAHSRAGEKRKNASGQSLTLPGQIEPAAQTALYARLVGYVREIKVDLGDHVKQGQVVAVLAVPEFEADVKQKQALVAEATAELDHSKQTVQEAATTLALANARVKEAEQGVKQADAVVAAAQAELAKARKLPKDKAGTAERQEEAAQQLEAAHAAVEDAQAKLQVTKATREDVVANRLSAQGAVKVAEAHLQVARAEAARAEIMLGYAQLRAPFDGVITKRMADVGLLAGPPGTRGRPLFTLTATDPVRFVAEVPENADLGRIRVGTAVTVTVKALRGRRYQGKVTHSAGALDPTRHTLRIEMDLANADGSLLSGMRGTVQLHQAGAKE
jgi:HlyD family secretion protein